MVAQPHDDDVGWEDESDPTHVDAPASVTSRGSVPRVSGSEATAASGTGSALLVAYGVFAGIYLLFTIAWAIAAMRNAVPVSGEFPTLMYRFGQFLSIAAPALFAVSVVALTRHAKPMVRVLLLVLGVLILVPWPFVVR